MTEKREEKPIRPAQVLEAIARAKRDGLTSEEGVARFVQAYKDFKSSTDKPTGPV